MPPDSATTPGENPDTHPPGQVITALDYRAAPSDAQAATRHPARGLASVAIGLFVILGTPCVVLWAGYNWGRGGPPTWIGVSLNTWLISCPLLLLGGLGLGIASLRDQQNKKLMGIIGVVFNAVVLAIGLFCVFLFMMW